MPGNHLIGDPGEARDFRRERNSGIFEPIPRADHPIDPPVVSTILEHTHAEFDDLVVLGIGAGGLDIDDGRDELRIVVRRMVFGSRLEPTNDAVIAALDQRISHLFERGVHLADIAGAAPPFNGSMSAPRMHRLPKPRVSLAGGSLMLDFLFGVVSVGQGKKRSVLRLGYGVENCVASSPTVHLPGLGVGCDDLYRMLLRQIL